VEELKEKVEVYMRMTTRMDEQERKLMQQIKTKEQLYNDLSDYCQNLKRQCEMNSDALEKSAMVIKKLQEDLEKAIKAGTTLQNENETLK